MRVEIRSLVKDIGITCLYVTHDQREALAIADRVLLMESGHVVQHGTPQQLYAHPADSFVAGFIGAANIVPLAAGPADGATGRAEAAAADLGTIIGTVGTGLSTAGGSAAEAVATFRPDDVVVRPDTAAGPTATNQWSALVAGRTYEGSSSQLTLAIGQTVISARVRGEFQVADHVVLEVPAERVLFVPLRTVPATPNGNGGPA
jgi:ABC-type Fe3+/spermidine/putrescine transport system ATPase subunit